MKVLHVGAKNFPPAHGGVERVVYDLATNMPHVESHVLVEWPGEDLPPRVGVLAAGLLSRFRQVLDYVRRERIDVVHLHKETFVPLGLLLKAAGVKCLVTIHGCAWRLARWPLHARAALFALDCLCGHVMDRTVYVGEHDWRLFSRISRRRRCELVCCGIDAAPSEPARRLPRAVYLGRISPEKNVLALVDAAGQAGVELDLYGPFDRHDDAYKLAVLQAVARWPGVQWRGAVPAEQVAATLAGYRVFINPSFSEGLPVSVLEAASASLHLVLSDIPQHRLMRMPGCTYVNPKALDLSGVKPAEAPSGRANSLYVRQRYTVARMVDEYSRIYEEIVA